MPVRDDDARRFVAEHFGSRVTGVRALGDGYFAVWHPG